jgi:KDO2-lipid IV(A) lauroyltransferase
MSKLLFYFFKAIGYLPFWFWFGVADFFWILNYYLIGYRKKVVRANLDIAFPEKTDKEKRRIEKLFFRNFSDFIIESIKTFSMSEQQFDKRYKITNLNELIQVYRETNKGGIMVAAHVFNWEWMISLGTSLPDDIVGRVSYSTLSNKTLDKLIKNNRERFGLKLSPSYRFAQVLEEKYKEAYTISGLIADQSPKANYKFRTKFFGIDVPAYTGPEKLARQLDQSFWFLNTKKVKRGYYEIYFELITKDPKQYEENELTKLYLGKTEALIRKSPENYLWTHRRWKHRK